MYNDYIPDWPGGGKSFLKSLLRFIGVIKKGEAVSIFFIWDYLFT